MLNDFDKFTARGVVESDFSSAQIRRLFRLATSVQESGARVTHASIVAAERDPELAIKLAPTLASYRALVPADHERLRKLARLRAIRDMATQAAVHAERGEVDEALELLDSAKVAAFTGEERNPVLNSCEMSMRFLERLQESADKSSRVDFGLPLWKQALGRAMSGSMTVIAADTNVGKTSYALELLAATARDGTTVGFVSCEDPEDIVESRMLASFSPSLSSRELQNGTVRSHQFADMELAMGLKSEALGNRMLFSFPVGGTEFDVCGAMARMAASGCKVVVVDYIQCVESSKRQQDRRNEIRWTSSMLKAHAKRLGIALILLSQLTMPANGEAAREPTKHDLKESRDLANAAEWVVVLWRDDDNDASAIHCKLAKSKNGNVGARWQIARNGNARLVEVEKSYLSASEVFERKRQFSSKGSGHGK
jgi:replicative DNA helicase